MMRFEAKEAMSLTSQSEDNIDLTLFFFSSRRRHTRYIGDWSSDVCSSDLRCMTWLYRNDVGRVARYGTVQLSDVLSVERYSHVMHLCSNVTGQLVEGKTAFRSEERRVGKEWRTRGSRRQ